MAHEETVMEFMSQLVIADKQIIGDLMAHEKIWSKGVSSVNNSYKALENLVGDKLEKGEGGYYRVIGCRSEWKEHSKLLSQALASIIKIGYTTKIFREHTISEKGLRVDAAILLAHEGRGLCFILEVKNHEKSEYYAQKVHTLEAWDGALDYLSQLFNTEIKNFDIITDIEEVKACIK